MVKRNLVCGMDIGTSHVRSIVGEINNDGTINIIGVGTSPSDGLKKGVIVDLDKTVDAITQAVEEAERMVGTTIPSAFLGIVGSQVGLVNNRGVVAVSAEDKEITEDDVERVLQAARVIALPPDREIIDVIPREFIVDGYDGIRDPVGMVGVRLEVDAMIITGMVTSIRNLVRCVERAGLEIDGMVLNSLANSEIALSRDEKELGTVLIDIGGGTTEVSVFQNGHIKDIAVLPVGGDYITNDIAVGLRTSIETAEKLKREHGVALPSMAVEGDSINLPPLAGKEPQTIKAQELAMIIEPRLVEMLQLAAQELNKMGFREPLPAGVVLTGGVSMMPGLVDLAEQIFDSSVRIAQPAYVGVKSPIYSTAVGIIHYVQHAHMFTPKEYRGGRVALPGIFNKVKSWFVEMFD
ncbi:cell division protein FtsA [Dethiobacter alkaliphilus]|uniref:cell division protein FtsA n=1 Tax=Dethiobacter alkaliphilus TaxID=427926 RepID=UPI002227E8EC|nr:cell division protein FtsA [Dethiobacter alkaliphilus]MCW3491230.1 cell division protein FtsA [Dethiobacter alkaliphilus]